MKAKRPVVRTVISSAILSLFLLSPLPGQPRETGEPHSFLLEWGSQGSGNGQFDEPYGVAADAFGNVFVVEGEGDRVQKFDANGNYVTGWGSFGTWDSQFRSPQDIAVDQSGNVYVADCTNNRISKFDGEGNFIITWGWGVATGATTFQTCNSECTSGIAGSGDGQFFCPAGVTVDPAGNVYVSDENNDRVQRFDASGQFLGKWGSLGSSQGQINSPRSVAADQYGNVYVADSSNHRIQKFDSFGVFQTSWGSQGFGNGQFVFPEGVAVDALGNVYVADGGNNRVQKFDSSGSYITEWGTDGSGDGQFAEPFGLGTDPFGNVYVADTYNYRIQKFAQVVEFRVEGAEAEIIASSLNDTVAVRTLFRLQNNGAPRFAVTNTDSGTEWSFQQSGPGNFLISREGTGGPEMQVFQSGRVRMGPGGTVNLDLDPSGNLKIKGSLTANGGTFPDYVFGPEYRLMPLSDLRDYIEQNQRLPNLPSAEEVSQRGGHNMTELQLKLLEKIEELTLYTLEQDSELQKIKRENALLKERLASVESKVLDR